MLDIENHDGTDPENNSELLYQVAYCSVLKQHMDTAAVQEIVTHAQRNNLANHITGMLMIEQGLVIQWLEGDLSAVKNCGTNCRQTPGITAWLSCCTAIL